MRQTIELHPHYLDISRDLDETIRLYKEAGFWDNAWDVTKGVLYGGSENNQWANWLGYGLMAASMLTPLGAGRVAGSLAMRAAPRLLGRFATRGAGRMAANAAARAGTKGVATAAGKAVANTAGKTVANTAGKTVANTAGKTVANTAKGTGRRALPDTKTWVGQWNEVADQAGSTLRHITYNPNAVRNTAQAVKNPGVMQQMGQRLGQYGTQMKQFGQQMGQKMSPYTAKAKELYQRSGQKLAPYSAQAGQPMSQWTGKQWAGELGKSLVGKSNSNALNWGTFVGSYGLSKATGNDDIFQARMMAPWALTGAKNLAWDLPGQFRQGARNALKNNARKAMMAQNPEYAARVKEWQQQGKLVPKQQGRLSKWWNGTGGQANPQTQAPTQASTMSAAQSPNPADVGTFNLDWNPTYAHRYA